MTIIQPNKNEKFIGLAITAGLFGVFVVVLVVSGYLETVGLRHDLDKRRAALEKLRVENVELKNKLFEIVDSHNLEELARRKGLVKEKNPQWVSASQL